MHDRVSMRAARVRQSVGQAAPSPPFLRLRLVRPSGEVAALAPTAAGNASPPFTGWRLNDPFGSQCDSLPSGSAPAAARPLALATLRLLFQVSMDEEFVYLAGECDGRRIDFGARAHHYLLLTLARRRAADEKAGLPGSSCGWVDVDDLRLDHGTTLGRVNLDVYRIRRQLEDSGFVDGRGIVERRARARQLRIGVARIEITRV